MLEKRKENRNYLKLLETAGENSRRERRARSHLSHVLQKRARVESDAVHGRDLSQDMRHYAYGGRFGRHVAADVRHERYQRDLLEVGALAGGVRPGQNLHQAPPASGMGVVRHVRRQKLLQRVPTFLHRYNLLLHHVRPHVIVFARDHVKRQQSANVVGEGGGGERRGRTPKKSLFTLLLSVAARHFALTSFGVICLKYRAFDSTKKKKKKENGNESNSLTCLIRRTIESHRRSTRRAYLYTSRASA